MSGITINIVKLGSGEEQVSLPEGATYGDLLAKVKADLGENVVLQNRGTNVEEKKDEKVKNGDRVQAVPRQYKQGR